MPLFHAVPLPQENFVLLPLTRGQVAMVSPEDYARVSAHKWMTSIIRGHAYATRGAMKANGRQSIQYLHRYIIEAKPGQKVDHIDGNGLNNTRSNLRIATQSENSANRDFPATANATGFVGVYRKRGKFIATVQREGHIFHVGTFATAEAAARARDAKALELFGPFARLNFPIALSAAA